MKKRRRSLGENGVRPVQTVALASGCSECGGSFSFLRDTRGAKRVTCSDRCRQIRHRRLRGRKA